MGSLLDVEGTLGQRILIFEQTAKFFKRWSLGFRVCGYSAKSLMSALLLIHYLQRKYMMVVSTANHTV